MSQVLLFYKYVDIEAPEILAADLRALAKELSLTGRILIAEEGINGTVEGSVENTEAFAEKFLENPLFSDVSVKRSEGDGEAFPKLSVKVREEIVGTDFPKEEAYPQMRTAPRISPEELRSWYERGEDFTIVDMRNDYEYASGHFKDSIDPGLQASRDLPSRIPVLEPLKKKKVLTVCTGGIRCEKMSAYLMNNGFEDVYQLEDGIHGYMQKYPGKDFVGTLYTFDKRKTMHFGDGEVADESGNVQTLAREIVGICYLCEAKTEEYVNCANDYCHRHFLACHNCQTGTKTYCSLLCEETASSN
jgi:UPF0176 protein